MSQEAEEARALALEHNERGQAQYLAVCFDEAVVDYTHAIEADPTFHVAYYNRGQVHYRMGRFQEAIVDFKKTLDLQPDFEDAVKALAASEKALSAL